MMGPGYVSVDISSVKTPVDQVLCILIHAFYGIDHQPMHFTVLTY